MTHLKRLFWFAAWSVWLWLGFGLYRELPRDLGPVVSSVPLGRGEVIVGLFEENSTMITSHSTYTSGNSLRSEMTFRRWNLLSGTLLEEFGQVNSKGMYCDPPPPRLEFVRAEADSTFSKPPTTIYAGVGDAKPSQMPNASMHFLNLLSSEWFSIAGDTIPPIFHPSKPWVIFRWGEGGDSWRTFLIVVDLRSGRRLFEWKEGQSSSKENQQTTQPFFIGDDRIGVPIGRIVGETDLRRIDDHLIEIWSLLPSREPLKVIQGSLVGFDLLSSSGLSTDNHSHVAWVRREKFGYSMVVYDVDAERETVVEPSVSQDDKKASLVGDRSPIFSHDGRSVLNPITGRLYDADSGKLLWTARDNEILQPMRGRKQFGTRESWTIGFGSWAKSFVTHTVRNLSDGSLVHRTGSDGAYLAEMTSSDGKPLAFVGGALRELPPRVNWSLLFVLQAVLALPLILIWILQWRRRGRTLRVSAP